MKLGWHKVSKQSKQVIFYLKALPNDLEHKNFITSVRGGSQKNKNDKAITKLQCPFHLTLNCCAAKNIFATIPAVLNARRRLSNFHRFDRSVDTLGDILSKHLSGVYELTTINEYNLALMTCGLSDISPVGKERKSRMLDVVDPEE